VTDLIASAIDWLLTWFVHATIACALALAAGRWMIREPRFRDYLWKGALIAPLATSSIAAAIAHVPGRSGAGVVHLSSVMRELLPSALPPVTATVQLTSGSTETASARILDPLSSPIRYVLTLGMLIPAALTGARLVRRRRRFSNLLGARRATSSSLLGIANEAVLTRTRRPVRVTMSDAVGSAAALGRAEVCVAAGAFERLAPAERRSIIAHEVAHLDRRDPAWTALAQTLASVMVVVPLIGMVAHRFRRDAEFICDDVAIRRVGNAMAHVRALAVFANAFDPASRYVATFASEHSPIVQRAERILGAGRARRSSWSAGVMTAGVAVAAFALLWLLPFVSTKPRSEMVRSEVRTILASPQARATHRLDVTVKSP
jgi:beta-lactamase regulating signal transducer with metallopeptidase domain